MKRKLLFLTFATALVIGGCKAEKEVAVDDSTTANTEDVQSTEAGEEVEDLSQDADLEKDYTEDIQEEINGIVTSHDLLSDEIVAVDELYQKYFDLKSNAGGGTQGAMNQMAQWEVVVWKTEAESLLARINTSDSALYQDIKKEYDGWEDHVDAMAEKMAEDYKDGSIYSMMVSDEKAIRYRRKAFSLATTLAELEGEPDFTLPSEGASGIYGDYTFKGDYLVIVEGMESGSYSVTIHLDGKDEITGWAYEGDEFNAIEFESEDGKVSGTVAYSSQGATFYVKESILSDYVEDESYMFDFCY